MLDKIRIVARFEKRVKTSKDPQESHFGFYIKYAKLVSDALRKPLFQRFLKWIMKRERIEEHKIKDVQIRVFPSVGKNGNGLAGRCDSKGRIFLFPKRRRVLWKRTQKRGKADTELYMKRRARAALIHELLHLKYLHDEKKVRELTERYLMTLTKGTHH